MEFCFTGVWRGEKKRNYHRITELTGLGGTCGDHSVQLRLPRQGHLWQETKELIQEGFGCLQAGRHHNLFRQPVTVLCHPQCKAALPQAEMKCLVVQFMASSSCHQKKSLASFSWYFYTCLLSYYHMIAYFQLTGLNQVFFRADSGSKVDWCKILNQINCFQTKRSKKDVTFFHRIICISNTK